MSFIKSNLDNLIKTIKIRYISNNLFYNVRCILTQRIAKYSKKECLYRIKIITHIFNIIKRKNYYISYLKTTSSCKMWRFIFQFSMLMAIVY